MYVFHTTIHARPAAAVAGKEIELAGQRVCTLEVSHEELGAATFACTFEEAIARLEQLERMYCEPDGSFVWVSSQGEPAWQVDGNLYDRNERLLFVDAKGTCPAEQFDRLLAALGWPETPVMFQLVRQAVLLDEAEFRRASGG
jgi:hypothetical protein